jgi:hypothetical protein
MKEICLVYCFLISVVIGVWCMVIGVGVSVVWDTIRRVVTSMQVKTL